MGASTASTGQIAPHVNATAEVQRRLQRARGRDLGDAELVARVRAELVVGHELVGDEAGQAGLDAAVLVDLRELAQLGLGGSSASASASTRRSASSASRCELTEMYSPAAIDIAPADQAGDARR